MSVTLMAAAFRYAEEQNLAPPRRLVLYVLADVADDDGRLWYGQKRLRRLTGLSVSTIRKSLREFEAAEILTTEARSRTEGRGRTSNLYVLHLLPPVDGDKSSELPPPPGEPPRREVRDQPPGDGGPIDGGTVSEPSVGTTQPVRPKSKVAGKVVTDVEYLLADSIVAAFNAAAGTVVTTDAHLTPVVLRIREKPDLTAGDHRAIIAAVFAAPWWSGGASPAVIYGNKAQFERSIETWRAAPAKLRLVQAAGPARMATKMEVRRLVRARADLRRSLPPSVYGPWIKPLRLAGISADTVHLSVSEGNRAWCERRYTSPIAAALAAEDLPGHVSFDPVVIDDHREAA